MLEIIDLSQEIFPGMPVFPGLPEVAITIHASYEQWDGITDSDVVSPAVNRLELGEHKGSSSYLWRVGLYALQEHDQFVPANRSGAFSFYWSAAQDTWRNRLAGAGHCCLRGVR